MAYLRGSVSLHDIVCVSGCNETNTPDDDSDIQDHPTTTSKTLFMATPSPTD